MISKVCTKCKKSYPATAEFFWSAKQSRDGLYSRCKTCANTEKNASYNRRYSTDPEFRERMKAKSRDNWAADPDGRRAIKLKSAYGIDLDEYNAILDRQGGTCALCPATACTDGRNLHVDHDHETGAVRGLLCNHCNLLLGHAGDSVEKLTKALEYLS